MASSRPAKSLLIIGGVLMTIAIIFGANVASITRDNGEVFVPSPPMSRFTRSMTFLATSGLFALTDDGRITLWRAETGKPVVAPIVHGGVVGALAFSPDDSRLLSGGNTRASMLWDTSTGRPVGTPLRQQTTAYTAAFSPDGTRMATGSEDGSVRIWDVAQDKSIGQVIQHNDRVVAAAYSIDGLRILTESDGSLQLRDATTGEAIGSDFPQQGKIGRILFSPDGSQVLILGRPAKLWDVATGQLIGSSFGSLHGVAFSPDGSRIVAGLQQRSKNAAQVWDAGTLEPIGDPLKHTKTVTYPSIVFIHGGGYRAGDKAQGKWVEKRDEAARKGYVAVSVNYRLITDDQDNPTGWMFPDPIVDVKCAVRFLKANADLFGLDPTRIGVAGTSSGGNAALMVGLSAEVPGFEVGDHLAQSSSVRAVVNMFGSTDYTITSDFVTDIELYLGGTIVEVPVNYAAASPVFYPDPLDPPVLTLHGDADTVVPVNQALDLAMAETGAFHEMVICAGEPHGFVWRTKRKNSAAQDAWNRMYEFFAATLGGAP